MRLSHAHTVRRGRRLDEEDEKMNPSVDTSSEWYAAKLAVDPWVDPCLVRVPVSLTSSAGTLAANNNHNQKKLWAAQSLCAVM